jgi:site-specific recombinase
MEQKKRVSNQKNVSDTFHFTYQRSYKPAAGKMVQLEQTDEFAQERQMAEYFVQTATRVVCRLECMPRLLIENVFLKSIMNKAVQVRLCEALEVKIPLLTLLAAVFLPIHNFALFFTFRQWKYKKDGSIVWSFLFLILLKINSNKKDFVTEVFSLKNSC